MTGNSVIPLQFVHSRRSPFLANFTINPLFQLFGATPCSFTLLNSFVSSCVLSSKSGFRSSATTLSSPAAFPFFVAFIALFTSLGRNGPISNSPSFCLLSISRGWVFVEYCIKVFFPDLQSSAPLISRSSVFIVYCCTHSSRLTRQGLHYSM